MGNTVISRRHGRVKLMKLDGQVMKIKAPVTVKEVLRDYPGHVVLDSEAVRRLGVRAKPLDGYFILNPKHLYFVLELPKLEEYPNIRRAITTNSKHPLENLVLDRRSVSDVSIFTSSSAERGKDIGTLRLTLRLTKAQVVKLMLESHDSAQITKKLLELCLEHVHSLGKGKEGKDGGKRGSALPWKPSLGSIPESCKGHEVI